MTARRRKIREALRIYLTGVFIKVMSFINYTKAASKLTLKNKKAKNIKQRAMFEKYIHYSYKIKKSILFWLSSETYLF
jgi:hypothetical protein